MHPANHRPRHGNRRRTFFGQVAYRVKHKIAVKIAITLLKLAAVASLGLLFAALLLLLYVARTF